MGIFENIFKVYRFLFARKVFYKANKFLYRLSLSGMGVLNFENDAVSGERFFLNRLFLKGKPLVIFDVGANEGNYAKIIRDYSKESKIYCFEPHPKTFEKLKKNTSGLNVTLVNKGCGSKKEHCEFFDYSNSDGTSHATLYKGVIEELHRGKSSKVNVDIIPLDYYIESEKINRINLLKIDVEGAELSAIMGAKKTIQKNKVDLIQFEFNSMNIKSKAFFLDFVNILPNYEFYRLLPDGLAPMGKYDSAIFEIFAFQNVVAIRKDIKKEYGELI